jgi:cytidylate kinase
VQRLNTYKNIKPVIAIDGTAGSGKGTLAKKLSEELKFDHLDTGLLYRIYAYESINNEKNIDIKKWFKNENDFRKLRTENISKVASRISKLKYVRDSLITLQRNFADYPPSGIGSVIDGRDIGTIIVPKAEIKFFVSADIEVRALRRVKQLNLSSSSYKSTLKNMVDRDNQDSKRKISPLKKAKDSFFIDTSNLKEREVFEIAINYIKKNTDFI